MIDVIRATIVAMIAEDRTMIDMDHHGAETGEFSLITFSTEVFSCESVCWRSTCSYDRRDDRDFYERGPPRDRYNDRKEPDSRWNRLDSPQSDRADSRGGARDSPDSGITLMTQLPRCSWWRKYRFMTSFRPRITCRDAGGCGSRRDMVCPPAPWREAWGRTFCRSVVWHQLRQVRWHSSLYFR